ncbi:beta-lactamase family protein [Sphingomonas sp. So64.6b]|uniref:serine hydrolase domain-containing protein n=1 Tax=Sphingomonas sp. So64.6b TaxID=2997354 RepID=UPI001603880C|nr:serine hydrolase domain-containing protein [Sphingomonas sp. So64.6b]QNA86471.1 beta-lactamase family protein [Sphingomonas sp. So64.6b]
MTQGQVTRRGALGIGMTAMAAATPIARAAVPDAWAGADAAARAVIDKRLAPGVSYAVMRDGRIVHSFYAGLANMEAGTVPAPHSPWRIGSLSKQFTVAALFLLAEQGKLSLDDPLARYMPEFPRADAIRLRQMLNHTSGLGNYTDIENVKLLLNLARSDYDDAELVQLLLTQGTSFKFEAGKSWAYSNTAYVLLGMVAARVAGTPLARLLRERLFDPLGLNDTRADDEAEIVPGRVSGYTPSTTGAGFANASFLSLSFVGAAGNLRSTVTDLCRWHDRLLGGHVLQPASLAAMLAPVRLADGTLAMEGEGAKRAPSGHVMGLQVATSEQGRVISHTGGLMGFVARMKSFPDRGTTVALMVNCEGGFGAPTGLREAAIALEAEAARTVNGNVR